MTKERVSTTVQLNWKEVYYTNCPLVSASNVDQELGWTKEEYKKIGVNYLYLRARAENDWYPHYIHNLDNLIRFGGLFPPDPRPRRHPPDPAAGRDARAARGRRHDGARPGRHLPDEGSEGQEDRPLEEPEHHQDRLVAHPGGAGHRADAPAQRHDPRRRRDRRVPLPGRLVRQARDDGPADGEPVRAVAAARPQARPGLPSAGDGAREGRHRRDVHAEPGPCSSSRRRRASSRRSRTCPGIRTGPCRWPTSPPPSPAPT